MPTADAERALIEWATVANDRDRRILAAHAAGISKNRIHVLTGIARTTIDRVLKGIAMNAPTYTARCNVQTGDITVLVPSEDSDLAVIDGRTVFTSTTVDPWGENEMSMKRADDALADLGWSVVEPWGELDMELRCECQVISAR